MADRRNPRAYQIMERSLSLRRSSRSSFCTNPFHHHHNLVILFRPFSRELRVQRLRKHASPLLNELIDSFERPHPNRIHWRKNQHIIFLFTHNQLLAFQSRAFEAPFINDIVFDLMLQELTAKVRK